jgi:hypothetical protein
MTPKKRNANPPKLRSRLSEAIHETAADLRHTPPAASDVFVELDFQATRPMGTVTTRSRAASAP